MADTRTLSQFKAKLAGGAARANLFEVSIPTFPSSIQGAWGPGDDAENGIFKFLCKSANLPASNIGSIDIPFRGRILKVAGDRTFENWTVTVINDQDFGHYRAFQAWAQNIAQYGDSSGLTDPSSYMGNATVYQLGRNASSQQGTNSPATDSNILAQYKFVDIFPTTIAAIDLSYDTTDTIEEFTVDFQVQYWYPEAAGSGA